MKKFYSLLLLGGLLLFGVQSVWADALTSLYMRYSTDYGKTWTIANSGTGGMVQTSSGSDIWKQDISNTFGNYWLVFQFTPSNTSWDNQIGASTADLPLTIDKKYTANNTGDYKNIVMITQTGYNYTVYYDHGNNKYWIESSNANIIYFYNTVNWPNVYVNIDVYWDDNKGSGNNNVWNRNYEMSQIGSTKYWMCKYTGASAKIAFTRTSQMNMGNFYETDVVYRSDYNNGHPVFVPCTTMKESKNSCGYYSNGAWIDYDATSFTRDKAIGGFGTICSPVNATITGGTLYEVMGRYGTTLYLSEKASEATTLVAGTPYFYKATAAAQTVTLGGASYEGSPLNVNGLYGTYTKTSIANESNYYVLSNNTILAVDAGACYVGANRAYLKMNDGASGEVLELDEVPTSAPGRPIIAIDLGTGEATEIHNIQASEESVKFYQDGKLLIQKNGVVYDMMGTIVK